MEDVVIEREIELLRMREDELMLQHDGLLDANLLQLCGVTMRYLRSPFLFFLCAVFVCLCLHLGVKLCVMCVCVCVCVCMYM